MTDHDATERRAPGPQSGLTPAVSVDNCEREPIHIPGSIQPQGALLAFEPGVGTVRHASANLGDWLPLGRLPAQGRRLSDLVGDEAYAHIGQALQAAAGGVVRHQLVDLPARPEAGQPQALTVAVHSHRNLGIAEIYAGAAAGDERDWMQLFNDTIDALRTARDLDDLVGRAARHVKRLTGLDRVMVYRFDDAWNGRVVADAHEPGMESFRDLHYPASDIPAQARELYRSNLVRYIADVDYARVPVLPSADTGRSEPLDMSHATLRSVSPMHLQYLRNMGVRSTLTLSLLVDGRLWGLIAGHHRTPTALPLRLRRAAYALAVSAGYMVGWNVQRERTATAAALVAAQGRIIETFNQVQAPLAAMVEQCTADLLRLAGASGGAFWHDRELIPFGRWPGGERAESIVRFVRHAFETGNDEVFTTERADLLPALGAAELGTVCGIMAARLDAAAASAIVWLRPEYRHEVAWGGDPDKPVQVEVDEQGRPKLSPRSSFARWSLQVQGHSRAWSDLDRDAARALLPLRQVLVVRESLSQVALSDRRLRGLVALQSDAYWQLDTAGRIVTLSKPLPTGHGPVAGQTLLQLLGPACGEAALEPLTAALHGDRPFRGLALAGHAAGTGTAFALLVSGEPMRDLQGHRAGWHGTISDVTRQRAVEEALRQKEVAEASNLAKSRFLSQISHELRTPLNAVLGFAALLRAGNGLSETQRQQLGHIHSAGEWLLAMISDLLDLSRIEAGSLRLSMAPVDVLQVVRESMELVSPQAAECGVRLGLEAPQPPVQVMADAGRLRQVLVNLASNGVKYNRPQGELRFVVQQEPGSRRVRIEVHDTGAGLSAEQQAQLFQPFNRLGRESQNIQGAGIGLVIARHFVEAMGGRMEVASEPGRGSCFAVEFDAARDGAAPERLPG